jgi:iron complex transport system permease protein
MRDVPAGKAAGTVADTARLSALVAIVISLFLLSFCIGRYPLHLADVPMILISHLPGVTLTPHWSKMVDTVVMDVRLPRLLSALLVGMALSGSGAAYQGVFRNPMVSPDILGVAAGASFGASLAILCNADMALIQIAAFGFGLLAVAITYAIVALRSGRSDGVLMLVLVGIIVDIIFAALVALLKYTADPDSTLPEITFWLMGSLTSISMRDLYFAAIPILTGGILLWLLRWRLNILSFGDEEASTMGVNVRLTRGVVVIGATLMTSAAVSIAGVVSLIGLVVPHLTRMIVGPNYARMLPISMLFGAGFLLGVDDLARTLGSGEIPLGILSSLIGAPIFLYLLLKTARAWT